MYFSLILTCAVLFTAGLYAAASSAEETSVEPPLSQKEKIRQALTVELQRLKRRDFEALCPRRLLPEQIVFGNQKLVEFTECGNATIDIFIAKLDDNVKFDELTRFGDVVREYATPVCEIFDDIFRCIGELSPAIDMCLSEREKVLKNKLFVILPLIQQTICLRNGALIADIVQHVNGTRCFDATIDRLGDIGVLELFESEATELFGDETVCQRFNDVLKEIYAAVGECSVGVLEMLQDMLGFFCEGTKCDRFLHDLKCYT